MGLGLWEVISYHDSYVVDVVRIKILRRYSKLGGTCVANSFRWLFLVFSQFDLRRQSLDRKASIQDREKPEGRPYSMESVMTSVGWEY